MKMYRFPLLVLIVPIMLFSAEVYFISFADKGDYTELLDSPEEYLSERALKRRAAQNIAIDSTDIPVLQEYISEVASAGGIIRDVSKWENGVIAKVSPGGIGAIESLPFVTSATLIKKTWGVASSQPDKFPLCNPIERDYGVASTQVEMLNADELNARGFTGEGMFIAIFDVGFRSVNSAEQFKHLYDNNQIRYVWNYPDKDSLVYVDSDHGSAVLSVMAAKIDGKPFGIAPDAEYMLAVTEDSEGEFRIEEYNWLIAAEKADSLGVDVINTSLVYYNFNDPTDDYPKEALDGNTSVITNAADRAASKGILVVSCAGNNGNNSWGTIAFPADGDSVLTVGAVNGSENYVSMSSPGPTADDRIKPDVVAMGEKTYVVGYQGVVKTSSGTSLSSPLIAAFAACLWQAHPNLSNMQMIEFIKALSSNSGNPNNSIGYGIPRYTPVALHSEYSISSDYDKIVSVNGKVSVEGVASSIKLYSMQGRLIKRAIASRELHLHGIPTGSYVLQVKLNGKELQKLIRIR